VCANVLRLNGRFAESGAHPVVLAAGIKPGEELRTRAHPAFASTVGGYRGDRSSRLCVLATNQRGGPVGSSASEDCVGSLVIRSDLSLMDADGVAEALTAPQRREQAHKADRPREGDPDERRSDTTGREDASLGELQRAVLVDADHESIHLSLACLLAKPSPERCQHVLGGIAAFEAREDYRLLRRIDLRRHVRIIPRMPR
jgi:hypothetical protein